MFEPTVVTTVLLALGACAPPATPGTTAPAPAHIRLEAAATRGAPATLAAAPDQFFTSGDATIRFREAGRGEPIVLIHGFAGSLEWPRVADSLAVDHRVIALDVRGFGRSTRFTDPRRYGRAMADDVPRLLDHLGLARAHLVGHSMGAVIAADAAQRHPQRASSVTLIAGAFFPDSAAAARSVDPWLTGLEEGEGLRRLIRGVYPMFSDSLVRATSDAWMVRNDAGSMAAVLRSFPQMLIRPEGGPSAAIPALVIVGSADPLLPDSRRVAEWWPGATYREVEGANHGNVLTRNETLAAIRGVVR